MDFGNELLVRCSWNVLYLTSFDPFRTLRAFFFCYYYSTCFMVCSRFKFFEFMSTISAINADSAFMNIMIKKVSFKVPFCGKRLRTAFFGGRVLCRWRMHILNMILYIVLFCVNGLMHTVSVGIRVNFNRTLCVIWQLCCSPLLRIF